MPRGRGQCRGAATSFFVKGSSAQIMMMSFASRARRDGDELLVGHGRVTDQLVEVHVKSRSSLRPRARHPHAERFTRRRPAARLAAERNVLHNGEVRENRNLVDDAHTRVNGGRNVRRVESRPSIETVRVQGCIARPAQQ